MATAGLPRVLLVDDTDLATLETILGPSVEVVATATDGAAALEEAATTEFDVAVVDYRMPGMDGLEVARRLKELKPDAKVVILTSYDVKDLVGESPHVDHYHEKVAIESLEVELQRLTGAAEPEGKKRRFGRH